jgi:CheY-like chemotaxis protein
MASPRREALRLRAQGPSNVVRGIIVAGAIAELERRLADARAEVAEAARRARAESGEALVRHAAAILEQAAALAGLVEELRGTALTPEQRELAGAIGERARILTELGGRAELEASAELDALVASPGPVAPEALGRAVGAELDAALLARHVEWVLDVEDDAPAWVLVDGPKLQALVAELARGALVDDDGELVLRLAVTGQELTCTLARLGARRAAGADASGAPAPRTLRLVDALVRALGARLSSTAAGLVVAVDVEHPSTPPTPRVPLGLHVTVVGAPTAARAVLVRRAMRIGCRVDVVGDATLGEILGALSPSARVDVLLLDPGPAGVALARTIEDRCPGLPIVLTMPRTALSAEAARYFLLPRPLSTEALERTLSTIASERLATQSLMPPPTPSQRPRPSFDRASRLPAAARGTEPGIAASRVLLADPDVARAAALAALLGARGREVTVVRTGARAVELGLARRFGLVLLSAGLPELDGPAVTRMLRAHDVIRGRPVPIAALLPEAASPEAAAFVEAGVDGHVAGPVDEGTLDVLLDGLERARVAVAPPISATELVG